jgi:hypothetical protein
MTTISNAASHSRNLSTDIGDIKKRLQGPTSTPRLTQERSDKTIDARRCVAALSNNVIVIPNLPMNQQAEPRIVFRDDVTSMGVKAIRE